MGAAIRRRQKDAAKCHERKGKPGEPLEARGKTTQARAPALRFITRIKTQAKALRFTNNGAQTGKNLRFWRFFIGFTSFIPGCEMPKISRVARRGLRNASCEMQVAEFKFRNAKEDAACRVSTVDLISPFSSA